MPGRRVELAILKLDQPEEPQGHRLRFRIAHQRFELRERRLMLGAARSKRA